MLEVGESGELQDIGELFFSESDGCDIAVALGAQIHPAARMGIYSQQIPAWGLKTQI